MQEEKNSYHEKISGVIVVDKPLGMSSHDVVQVIRKGSGLRRAGHTGTLDPRATGVLVVLVGPAVRLSEYVSAADKRYQATLRLGSATDTYDSEGKVTHSGKVKVTEEEFAELLKRFTGEIEQVPPPYSAVKLQGKKAYELSRKGEAVDLKPRKIHVYRLEILEWDLPDVTIDVMCSSGTYVRSLAHDIGNVLGCGAHLIGLRRTKSGRFTLRDATPLDELKNAFIKGDWYKYLIPAAEALSDWAAVELNSEQLLKIRHGHRIPAAPDAPQMARGVNEQGELVAVLEKCEDAHQWQPKKVFLQED